MKAEKWIAWLLADASRPQVLMRGSEAEVSGFAKHAQADDGEESRYYDGQIVILPEVSGDEVEQWR